MRRPGISLLVLAALLPAPLLAEPAGSPAPRQLTEAEQARLKQSIGKDKALLQQAVTAAEARQREIERIDAEAAAAAAYVAVEPEPEVPAQSGGGAAAILNAFTTTFASEHQKNMAIVNQGNADVALARQRLHEQQERERRQREQAEARQREQQRQQQEAAARHAASSQSEAQAEAQRQQQQRDAQLRDAKLREQAMAERQRLAAQQAQAGSQASPPLSRSAGSSGSATAAAGAATAHGPARAWCQASKSGSYQCMGPTQKMLSWEKSLAYALELAGCKGGQGYTPTVDGGGSGFNCGRSLRSGEYRMPEYDPYRGGGAPQKVTSGS
ncbi:MAG: hypothetical protein DI568_08640 [Sphingomonas sp.]|nr:MAG: hypothetical protein DI568_08640 [Sphingomonas sp.]